MPLTKDFADTVRARAERDAGFRRELLREAVDCLFAGDVHTGKILLRDYINATIGFETLSTRTRIPVKSLMRMVGPRGNPQAEHLFAIMARLQKAEGVQVRATVRRVMPKAS